jgi:hypothetical protein
MSSCTVATDIDFVSMTEIPPDSTVWRLSTFGLTVETFARPLIVVIDLHKFGG